MSTPVRRRRSLVLSTALVGALVAALGANPTGAGAAVTSARQEAVQYDRPAWAAEWMVRKTSYTRAGAIEVAKRYDVIAAMSDTFRTHAAAMRAANPDLILLAYVNGPFAANWKPPYPESWYAHNANGGRVKSVTFGNPLMNPHTQQWRNEVVSICEYEKQRSNYDGCFLDSMGNGILGAGYLSSQPIDPRTGKVWNKIRWIQDTGALANHVRTTTGYPVATNGLGSGHRYFVDGGTHLAAGSDMSMAEGWLRNPKNSVTSFPTPTVWKRSVDMLVDSESYGTGVLAVTKLWVNATDAQRRDWYEYALGTFLLGTGGHSRLFFLEDGCAPPCAQSQKSSPLSAQPSPDLAMGTPTGRYVQLGNGSFTRQYTNGFAAVNPGDRGVSVQLPAGTYRRLHGGTVSGRVWLAPDRGVVLTRL